MSDFYDEVYKQDFDPGEESHGWIQWKGTDACIDLRCSCGYLGHYDGDFFYYYECPGCHRKYAVGQNVKLIPLTAEQAQEVEDSRNGFKTSTVEDEPQDKPEPQTLGDA